jgi:hypothetical protein
MDKPSPTRRPLLVVALLALAVAGAMGLRLVAIADKETFYYDEATTYMAATCHQWEYWQRIDAKQPPFGVPATASDWQRYMLVEDTEVGGRICPRMISQGLGRYDVHPPLYFWLLNGWVQLDEVSPAADRG